MYFLNIQSYNASHNNDIVAHQCRFFYVCNKPVTHWPVSRVCKNGILCNCACASCARASISLRCTAHWMHFALCECPNFHVVSAMTHRTKHWPLFNGWKLDFSDKSPSIEHRECEFYYYYVIFMTTKHIYWIRKCTLFWISVATRQTRCE